MRLSEIMRADPAARRPKRHWLFVALAAGFAPIALIQFAWAQGASPASAPASAPASLQPAAASPQAPASAFMAPIDGPISLGFGPRPVAVNGQKFHQGVDFPAPIGTPVRAPADGRVGKVYDWPYSYGKVIEIDHGNGLKTRFAHLDGQQVAAGDEVKAGQVIGTSGETGTMGKSGPHLHFEVWKNGKPIDPASMLPAKAG